MASASGSSSELSLQGIMEMASGFQASRVLLSAIELGLFGQLAAGPQTSAEVARALSADPRGTDRLMNALTALGLLLKTEGRFANGPAAAAHLVPGGSGLAEGLKHWVHLWESWGSLTEAVRRGGAVPRPPVGEREAAWIEAFIAAMHWRAVQHAPIVMGMLELAGVRSVLDVGGGSGGYAMAFVRAQPGLRATLFDLPAVLPLTARYVTAAGLTDAVALRAGDYLTDPLGEGFDLVFLSAILHSNTPEENAALLTKGAASLVPGGRLVVQEFVPDEERTAPLFPVLFALNMLVGTPGGDAYTESEIRGWMAGAGIGGVERRDTPFGTSLLTGRRGN
jgi:SAM-dependent methyltransferase